MQRTLLIVDDETDVCALLQRMLRRRFSRIECAHNLADGLALAAGMQPEVLLLDHNLPDGYGISQVPEFRHVVQSPLRLVIMSALDLRGEALAASADDFIAKPIDFQRLDTL